MAVLLQGRMPINQRQYISHQQYISRQQYIYHQGYICVGCTLCAYDSGLHYISSLSCLTVFLLSPPGSFSATSQRATFLPPSYHLRPRRLKLEYADLMRAAAAAAAALGISPADVFTMSKEAKVEAEAADKSEIDVLFAGSPSSEEYALGDPDPDNASDSLGFSRGRQSSAMPMAVLRKGFALPVEATVTAGVACALESPQVAEFNRLVQLLEANKVCMGLMCERMCVGGR